MSVLRYLYPPILSIITHEIYICTVSVLLSKTPTNSLNGFPCIGCLLFSDPRSLNLTLDYKRFRRYHSRGQVSTPKDSPLLDRNSRSEQGRIFVLNPIQEIFGVPKYVHEVPSWMKYSDETHNLLFTTILWIVLQPVNYVWITYNQKRCTIFKKSIPMSSNFFY